MGKKQRIIECDGCGKQVKVNRDRVIESHHTDYFERCPSSGLIDLTAPAGPGPWEVGGGLPTLGKHHR